MTKFSYKKFFKSFYYAFRGLVTLIETEQNARIHSMLMIFAGICAVAFRVENTEAALLFFAFVLVFAIEIINTAVEKLLDLIHPESHTQIAFIKDALAGAVLIAAIIAGMVFILVFYPYVKELL
ncbi:diacylglycerol kinase family protein [soil metagenome]